MKIRKEIRTLSGHEWMEFLNALLAVKAAKEYDKFVHWHHAVMVPTVHPHEPQDPDYRNGAHLGPAFLPWHREMLLQLEAVILRVTQKEIAIPYWDWTLDAAEPWISPVWGLIGGNGDPKDYFRVQDGPFAHKFNNWDVPGYPQDGLPEPGLKRQFGQWVFTLPTPDDLNKAMNEEIYDEPYYNASPFNRGFRNRLEGWITQKGDPQVTTPGSQLHNRVHLWIGGNMLAMTSPEDPVFFLHHCFVDKIWADWQAKMKLGKPTLAPHYCPMEGGPPGHNFDDVLEPWTNRIRDVMDITALDYAYDPSPPLVLPKPRFKSPFMT